MAEKVHLFASQRVNRKARTDNEEIFTEKVSLITNQQMSIGKLADFKQLVADMATAGIAISTDKVVIKAKQTMVVDENNNTTALFANGKLNAALIDADTITVNHLYARKTNGGSVVGHFGNADKNDAQVGSSAYPLWVGATVAANAPFRVASDGSLYSVRGTIGGFAIGETSIGSQDTTTDTPANMYLSKGFMIFNGSNDSGTAKAWLGTNNLNADPMLYLEAFKGLIYMGAEIKMHGLRDTGSINKYGVYANVTNGGDNFPYGSDDTYQNIMYSFYSERGNICADEGWVCGAKYNLQTLSGVHTELNIRKNNVWIVTTTTQERRLILPSLSNVKLAIGRRKTTSNNPFCVKVFIVVHRSSTYGFHVNARGISSAFGSDYPYMYDCNGTKFSEHDMSPGDSAEFLLIYDGTEYYAQLTQINK